MGRKNKNSKGSINIQIQRKMPQILAGNGVKIKIRKLSEEKQS
jgi:hypothetical protein